jgi:HD-GYP domain-containing protein (c-di-GMP phosphodiesterase class II)
MSSLPSRPASSRQTADDPNREHGNNMVTLLSGLIRIGRAYSVGNQVFRNQIEKIAQALQPIFQHAGDCTFVALETDLYLNGARVPVTGSSFRFHQTVIQMFRQRGISGFRAMPGVREDELSRFFALFLYADAPRGKALLKACIDAGLQSIMPALHASTDPNAAESYSGFSSDDEGDGFGGGGAGHGPGDGKGGGGGRGRGGPAAFSRKYHSQALNGARSLLTTTALHHGLEVRHAKRVVQPLVDGAYTSQPIVVGISSLRDHDETTYSHAVNVCAVAVTMGHFLGMDRKALADLGVGALLHDIGKAVVADRILHPLEAFTDDERAAAEQHPVEGAKLLARSTTLNSATLRSMRVALEHHASTQGDEGYPPLPRGWRLSLLSQIVMVADCYINLHTRRGELIEHISPYEALGMMLGRMRERFDPALLWALVQAVGFYPPGQLVELDNGMLAAVLAPNPHDLARPHVEILRGPDGRALTPEEPRELVPIPPERSVRRALRGSEYPEGDLDEPAAA